MGRIRYIKPDFWKDEDIAELPHQARLFFIGLWNFADKSGRLEYRPKLLKVEIFPYENVDIEKLMALLLKHKSTGKPFLQRYEVSGNVYLQILSWDRHQKPHHQEQASKIPPAPPYTLTEKGMGMGTGTESVLDEPAPKLHRINTEDGRIKDIICDLNLVLKTNYRHDTKETLSLISKRLEKFTVDDFKTVHRKMSDIWGNDEKMSKYLRPETLYGAKFESYLNMKEPQTQLSEHGAKALLVGQQWLAGKEKKDAGQE
jgi:uncharacterized phage protein (TIGR02220 family)